MSRLDDDGLRPAHSARSSSQNRRQLESKSLALEMNDAQIRANEIRADFAEWFEGGVDVHWSRFLLQPGKDFVCHCLRVFPLWEVADIR
jgi:hypothetical protein